MNKLISIFNTTFLFLSISITAQSNFGLKGGYSYNSNGNLKEFTSETNSIIKDKGKTKSGYNIGFYGKIDLGELYIRPELIYTKTTSEYVLNSVNQDFEISKIDTPLLIGVEVIGPISVFAGPSFQYILDNKLKGIDLQKVEDEFTVGLNIGVGLQLGRLGLDVRYERGLNSNEAEFTSNNTSFRLDTRPEQLIFNISYSFTKINK